MTCHSDFCSVAVIHFGKGSSAGVKYLGGLSRSKKSSASAMPIPCLAGSHCRFSSLEPSARSVDDYPAAPMVTQTPPPLATSKSPTLMSA
jgi:hypothetical protein